MWCDIRVIGRHFKFGLCRRTLVNATTKGSLCHRLKRLASERSRLSEQKYRVNGFSEALLPLNGHSWQEHWLKLATQRENLFTSLEK